MRTITNAILREFLLKNGLDQKDFAEGIGIKEPALSVLINAELTPEYQEELIKKYKEATK